MSRINYDLTAIRAFAFDVDGVLSPSVIPMSAEGEPMRMANIKDGYAMQLASKRGYPIFIITGGRSEAIRNRYAALGVKEIHEGCAFKLPVFEDCLSRYGLTAAQVAYVGDDIPDLPVLQCAGLPCCPSDAAHEVKEACNYISPAAGGYGCARDIIEQVLTAQGKWMSDMHAFGW